MKYIVEVHLKPGMKHLAVDTFEQHGPSRNPQLKFEKAWLGAKDDIAFVLLDSATEALVDEAATQWAAFGESRIYPVTDIEQY